MSKRTQYPPDVWLGGKDELNLADWRISAPQHEQPRTKDGGRVDFLEYVIDREGHRQQVTIEAPSRVGLPTPMEEDVLVGLIALSKADNFQHQSLNFSPNQLLKVLRWSDDSKSFDRLELALKRLVAVTITYELTWYDKITAEVQPRHVTGILSEARTVRRRHRGRCARGRGRGCHVPVLRRIHAPFLHD